MNHAVIRYFDRAFWALQNAHNDSLPPNVRSHLTAMAVHACQSLKEALDQVVSESGTYVQLANDVRGLPHSELIGNVRNTDLHGWPLPICDPNVQAVEVVTKPDQPITLTSSHGVGVSIRMDGLTPKVHRSPKDLKHGTATIGGGTVSFGCAAGQLFVHDFSTDKDHLLLDVLKLFLQKSHALIKDRLPSVSDEGQSGAG